jgi:hypothetical protein
MRETLQKRKLELRTCREQTLELSRSQKSTLLWLNSNEKQLLTL